MSRPSARLPLWLGLAASFLYVATFVFFISFSRTIFDATFFIGLIGVPLSLVASLVGGAFGHYTNLDLVFLFLFGMVQYFIIGYVAGFAVATFLARR